MADLQSIIARVKDALTSRSTLDGHATPLAVPPAIPSEDRRAELLSQFSREVDAVGGNVIGPVAPGDLADCIRTIVRKREIKSIAIGKGELLDLDLIARECERQDISVIRITPDANRYELRDKLAHVDGGLVEADYAIASTGTVAVLSRPESPSSLTLLPPASIAVLRIDRLLANLAAALEAIGSAALEAHRMTLITGPSRTADIEKRIVMGVHGPKSLDVVVVWPRDD